MNNKLFGILTVVLLTRTSAANATFIVDPNPGGDQFFNGAAYKDVNTFTGHVGGQNSGPTVTIDTVGNVDTGAGFSNIKPIKDGSLTSVTFTPTDGSLFDEFSFRGQLLSAAGGTVTLIVQDNQGELPQTFTFSGLGSNADFGRVGIVAVDGSGETIKSITLTSGGWKEAKQNEFSLGTGGSGDPTSNQDVGSVPEPSALILCGLGAVGLIIAARRRKA